ncbi:hypothetical protein BU14_0742s0006 [Porphyra umbilicalis]|uniref:Uncharacterized protein n=1 Tax=Porphyra umbilicalis TaxID=2786 RepID=A0A1X6NPI7_PORUM|nr:hypothetical protein BU14_0742s0006 [Porphyra umbilicalis]|eukprot:OSX70485.1 hypothetical protein BU14_0742s0006 [Porphyra umbilicalis]
MRAARMCLCAATPGTTPGGSSACCRGSSTRSPTCGS